MIKPTGKTIAEIVRMRPGAFAWNQGEEFVESDNAQPKESNAPPKKELANSLSIRVRAFLAPMRDTSSVVCAGVKASIVAKNGVLGEENGTEIFKYWRGEGVTVRLWKRPSEGERNEGSEKFGIYSNVRKGLASRFSDIFTRKLHSGSTLTGGPRNCPKKRAQAREAKFLCLVEILLIGRPEVSVSDSEMLVVSFLALKRRHLKENAFQNELKFMLRMGESWF